MLPFGGVQHGSDARVTGSRIANGVQHDFILPTGAAVGELAVVFCYQATTAINGGSGTAWNSIHAGASSILWRLLEPNDFVNPMTFSADTPYAAASVFGAKSIVLGSEDNAPVTVGFVGTLAAFLRAGGCVGFFAVTWANASSLQFSPAFVGTNLDHLAGTYGAFGKLFTDVTQIPDNTAMGLASNSNSDTRYAGVFQLLAV